MRPLPHRKTNNSPGRPGYHIEQKRRDPKQMSTSKKVLSKDFKNLTSTPRIHNMWGEPQGNFLNFEFPAETRGAQKQNIDQNKTSQLIKPLMIETCKNVT